MPYLLKSNLRIEYGAFQKELLADQGLTTGTLDTRFLGATLDPLQGRERRPADRRDRRRLFAAWNDTSAIGSATSRTSLQAGIPIYSKWDYKHQPPGADKPLIMLPNVLPDLAAAMKQNPDFKVMVNGGYFDVSTPYFEGVMEMRHLPIPASLRGNIEYHYYRVRPHGLRAPGELRELHANVADFIRRTSGGR